MVSQSNEYKDRRQSGAVLVRIEARLARIEKLLIGNGHHGLLDRLARVETAQRIVYGLLGAVGLVVGGAAVRYLW